MKRIGIIGGVDFETTLHYFEEINRKVSTRTDGKISADLVIRSGNVEGYRELIRESRWGEIESRLTEEALDLAVSNNCDFIALDTDVMHKVADRLPEARILVPLVHMGDCVAEKCKNAKVKNVVLVGPEAMVTDNFIRDCLVKNQIEVTDLISDKATLRDIDRIAVNGLRPKPEGYDRQFLQDVCQEIAKNKYIDGVILGSFRLEKILIGWFSEWLFEHCNGFSIIGMVQAHIDKLVDLCLSN